MLRLSSGLSSGLSLGLSSGLSSGLSLGLSSGLSSVLSSGLSSGCVGDSGGGEARVGLGVGRLPWSELLEERERDLVLWVPHTVQREEGRPLGVDDERLRGLVEPTTDPPAHLGEWGCRLEA